jgi:hypothetical protein
VRKLAEISGAEAGPSRDELAAAYAQGYAEGRARAVGELERRRRRLLAAIVSDSPARPEITARLAQSTGWPLPTQVAAAALAKTPQPATTTSSAGTAALTGTALPASTASSANTAPCASMTSSAGTAALTGTAPPATMAPYNVSRIPVPPDVLADLTGPEPCLLVPDPNGPGRAAALERALRGWQAAIGPTVPLARAAVSLRWARQALALARSGVIPANGAPVRCDQHLSTLLILADEDLARALRSARLAPLARLRPGQRDRIAETLLAWLQLGQNAAEVAHQMHVHPQTVRYRLRQIQQLFGDQLRDPDLRFELQVALRARRLLAGPGRNY